MLNSLIQNNIAQRIWKNSPSFMFSTNCFWYFDFSFQASNIFKQVTKTSKKIASVVRFIAFSIWRGSQRFL